MKLHGTRAAVGSVLTCASLLAQFITTAEVGLSTTPVALSGVDPRS